MVKNSMNHHQLKMSLFAFSIAFMLHLLLFSTAPLSTIIMKEMNLSHAGFAFIFGIAMISLVASRIPWGLIGDHIGFRNAFRIALPISAIAAVIRPFTKSYASLLLTQLALGFGLSSVLPILPILVKKSFQKNATGFATGIYIAGFAAGNATAIAFTPSLLNYISWRTILFIYALMPVLVSVFWWLLIPETHLKTETIQFAQFKTILKDRSLWVLLMLVIACMGGYDTLATWIPKVIEMKNLNPSLATFLPLGFFFSGPIIGFVSDRLKKRNSLLTLMGLATLLSTLGINTSHHALFNLCLFLAGFCLNSVLTISLAIPAELERYASSVGGVVGVISSLGNIGPLALPVVFGSLIDLTGTYRVSIIFISLFSGLIISLCSRSKYFKIL
ncbi:MAG: MFS transporter [Candidatus Atribacteria bacterium]|nr:MFS transporter [Candidatus Atribacteria bacterium]